MDLLPAKAESSHAVEDLIRGLDPFEGREQFSAEHHVVPGSHPSYRDEEPPSPRTHVTLLTGGLLVRAQPEEPIVSMGYGVLRNLAIRHF